MRTGGLHDFDFLASAWTRRAAAGMSRRAVK
jgi:hypothetical protein